MKFKRLKKVFQMASLLCVGFCMMAAPAGAAPADNEKRSGVMEHRVAGAAARTGQLFPGQALPEAATDPDFAATMERFIYGEVEQQGNLTDRDRSLVTLVVLETQGSQKLLQRNVEGALNAGVSPVEIKEAFYQAAPYIGFGRALEAIDTANEVFQAKGIALPLANQATVNEENRMSEGLAVQKKIFGAENIDAMYAHAAAEQLPIQHYLSAYCFGDTYTRRALDLKQREMLTMAAIASLGGCEPQLKAHIGANLKVGNSRQTIFSVLNECVPYIGFPRSLNAIRCMNEVFAAQDAAPAAKK